MVRVDLTTTDKITAWRIRDAMACHPLLGGCTAQISIEANHEHVTLSGWASDEHLSKIAHRLAQKRSRAAVDIGQPEGWCAVQPIEQND